jgi:hypothetical protein
MQIRVPFLPAGKFRRLSTALSLTVGIAATSLAPAHAASGATSNDPLEDQVAAHLEFGEFERAAALARQADDDVIQSQLLNLVADAQMKSGDFAAALGSIRTMPDYQERQIASSEYSRQQALAGGAQADFESLIMLIQSETNGMWEEIDGTGGTITEFEQGVRVEPSGVLRKLSSQEHSDRLEDLGIRAREALLNGDIATVADMRVISLTRLEQAVSKRLAEGRGPTVSMRLLGGLTKIENVFVYPEDGEIVLAGPAEPWKYNENGVAVGELSGRPVLQLDDFVTILRSFSANRQKFFSCSINPRQEGLKQLKDYVAETSGRPLSPGRVKGWTNNLQQKLGMQDIVYSGIDPESRVARVIIEADYRMKLIGIGKYDFAKGVGIPSIFDLMTAQEQRASKLDALRWWLTMKYDAVLHTSDENGFEFVGSSVLCQSENQLLNDLGQQVQTGKSEGSNLTFAQKFTEQYAELAKHDVVFADLQNVFDLALVAAILQHEGAAEKAGWNFGAFRNDGAYLITRYNAPTEVESVVNHRVFRGRDIVVQVAGGVRVDLDAVLDNQAITREGIRIASADKARSDEDLSDRRWWWDAE